MIWDMTGVVENQLEKPMDNEMETVEMWGVIP